MTRGGTGRLARMAPGVDMARRYERSWLRHDVVAGLVLTVLLIPAGMGYAEAAGLGAAAGLNASMIPLVVYAVFGPSRILVVGPDSTLAPLIAAAVLPLAGGDGGRAASLAALMAVLVGLFLVVGGLARLGSVTDLFSVPIRTGYLAGVAAVVMVGQSAKLLGFRVTGDGFWRTLRETVDGIVAGRVHTAAAVFGVVCVVVIAVARRWSNAVVGVAVAVCGSMAAMRILGDRVDLPTVGRLPGGFPAPSLGGLRWRDVWSLSGPAAGTALIAFADVGVLSRSLAARRGEWVDGSQEMSAVGLANVAAGCFGGFPVSASSSRTPVAEAAGARTQLAGVVGAATIVLFATMGRGLTELLPSATLAAAVIVAVTALVEPRTLVRLARVSRSEFALTMVTFVGVTSVGVLPGLAVAVGLSMVAFVQRAWHPHWAELGRVHELKGYHDLERHPEGERIPGLLIVRFDAPLFFANGAHFAQVVRQLVREADPPARWVVVAAEAITGLDTTAADEFVHLDDHLAERGVRLVFAELKGPIKDRLARFGLGDRFGEDRFFPTIGTAVSGYLDETGTAWVDWEDRQRGGGDATGAGTA